MKAGHGGRHSPRMLRSSSRNSSRCCRRTCHASPPHRAVCKGCTYRWPGWGAAPRQPPSLGKGGGERKRTCRTVHRPTSARLWAAQARRQPRSGSVSGSGSGSSTGSVPRRRFMAAAIARRRFPALAADWRERTSPRQQGSTARRGRLLGRGRPRRDKPRRKVKPTKSQNQQPNTPGWKRLARSPTPTLGSRQYPTGITPRALSKSFLSSGRLVAVNPYPGEPLPVPDSSLGEQPFPKSRKFRTPVQPKPP